MSGVDILAPAAAPEPEAVARLRSASRDIVQARADAQAWNRAGTTPSAAARRAASTAVELIDRAAAELRDARAALVAEIVKNDKQALARVAALCDEMRGGGQ